MKRPPTPPISIHLPPRVDAGGGSKGVQLLIGEGSWGQLGAAGYFQGIQCGGALQAFLPGWGTATRCSSPQGLTFQNTTGDPKARTASETFKLMHIKELFLITFHR